MAIASLLQTKNK